MNVQYFLHLIVNYYLRTLSTLKYFNKGRWRTDDEALTLTQFHSDLLPYIFLEDIFVVLKLWF